MSRALLAVLELEAGATPDIRIAVRARIVQVQRGGAGIRAVIATTAPIREAK